jgi:hypothetical protein
VKTLPSQSQRIVPMLPQQSVQPKNKEAYTVAPLRPPERVAKFSDPCSYGNKFYAVFASVVAKAGYVFKRDDGEA